MANLVGSTVPFNSQEQSWEEYCEVLQHFFDANGIEEAGKKRAILLSAVGSHTYSLIRNLLSPVKPGAKTYDDLVKLLTDHFNPKPSEIVQRFKFNSRSRKPGEAVLDYVAALRKLAHDCNYGEKLTEMLRDRLVCGIGDDRIQRRLLSEPELTFDKALKLAQAMEAANKDVQELQAGVSGASLTESRPTQDVHKMAAAEVSGERRRTCYRCGSEQHISKECRFITEKCHKCGKKGHIQRVCRSRGSLGEFKMEDRQNTTKRGQVQRTYHVSGREENYSEEEEEVFVMHSMPDTEISKVAPLTMTLAVGLNETLTKFEVDTGCGVTIMNDSDFHKLWIGKSGPELKTCPIKLKTYTGQQVKTLGRVTVRVKSKETVKDLPLVIVPGNGPNLLGRDWIKELSLAWSSIHHLTDEKGKMLQEVLARNAEVFKEELGKLKGPPAKIYVDKETTPRFFKPRPVPYAMRAKVEAELDRLLKDEVIEPVKYSEWAAPIVPVLKPDNSVRLCGDYKLTVNRVSKIEQYPIPRIEDLFANLSGGEKFSKLDMSHAYHQIALDDDSKKYVTVNTHKGLFTYKVLPFGVASSPAIFQRTIEGVLQGVPHVAIFLDDILLTGKNDSEHLETLNMVLQRLQDAGLRLKRSKCTFMASEVVFLGHRIDSTGLHPVTEKVRAIENAPPPSNVTELKAYLGLLNYYNKFLPNLATVLAPVHKLLCKDTKWKWGAEQQAAFTESKRLLQSAEVLVHYDPEKEIILSCDASPYGVGAVLSHRMPDGSERPIGFMSRTLSSAERNYSQLDKEGLAVIFGVQRFHKYIYGRKFTIVTDHKPLLSLFNEMKAVPQMASPRIQRWAVTLRAYEYEIIYRPGKDHGNADALSRLPLPEVPKAEGPVERVLMLENSDITLVTAEQIRSWTNRDPVLSRVREMVQKGWAHELAGEEFKPYNVRKQELSVQNGCVLWGARVIVPKPGQGDVLQQLHQCHPGVSRMKALARSYVWWPKMDQDVENLVKVCSTCQEQRHNPAVAPLHPWDWPDRPWKRLHVDYAGPYLGKMFFVIVDAHSKWMDVYPLNSATSATTIECLRSSFSTHGLPEVLVSDNGPCFISLEFQEFVQKNGILHVTSAPYHASSNGLAERAVQTFKEMMDKCPAGSIKTKVARVLFSYRTTPQTTTGLSPAELLMGRKLRCTLDLMHPDLKQEVQRKQRRSKENHDRRAKERSFEEDDPVFTKNFGSGPKWVPGIVASVTGPVSYKVMLADGRVVRRHVDQIHSRTESPAEVSDDDMGSYPLPAADTSVPTPLPGLANLDPTPLPESRPSSEPATQGEKSPGADGVEMERSNPVARQVSRVRRLPTHLKDFELNGK